MSRARAHLSLPTVGLAGGGMAVAVAVAVAVAAAVAVVTLPALTSPGPLAFRVGEPIQAVHQRLLQQGWQAKPDHPPGSWDLELAGDHLPSLESCSGTGMGYCLFSYRRGGQHLALVTVPGAAVPPIKAGPAVVVRWSLSGGAPQGLCQAHPQAPLTPCATARNP